MNDPDRSRPVKSRPAPDFAPRQQLAPLGIESLVPAHAEPVPEERRALAIMGETLRVGRWLVPRLFRVRAYLAEVRLDLRENPIPQDFTLDVKGFGSRVTLIVPPGTAVTFDAVVLLGNAINQANEFVAPAANQTRVRVKGSLILGEVRVLVRAREYRPH